MKYLMASKVHDYVVMLLPDIDEDLITVLVQKDGQDITNQQITRLKSFLRKAKALRIGWAKQPDDEVIYIYDKADENFGYAVNLNDPNCSEWGYAPF